MYRMIRWLALAAAVVVLAACSSNKDTPLTYVPADTPYVVANLKPLSDQALAGMAPASASTTQFAAQLAQVRDLASRLDQSNEPHLANLLRALIDLPQGQSYAQIQEQTGIDRHGLFALYGAGLSPVLRGQLSDPDRFKAYIAKLEKAYGQPFAKATLDKRAYQHLDLGKSGLQFLVATQGKQFVTALLPAQASTAQLRLVLGVDRPQHSIAGSGRLSKLAKSQGYGPYLAGYLDTTKLPALLAGAHDPLLQSMLQAAVGNARPADAHSLPATCEADLARIAARVPLISLGYTRLDAKETTGQIDIRLASDIVQAFQGAGTQVPGLGQASSAPLDFAMALPVPEFRKFWLAQAEAVSAKPFTCPALSGLNKMFAGVQAQLPKSGMPAFDDVRGFRLVLDHAAIADMQSVRAGQLPKLQARLLVASHNPAGLWNLAKASIAPLATLTVNADGKPVALPPALTSRAGQPAWIAMNSRALALGIGADERDHLSPMLDAPAAPPGTLMRMHVTGELYLNWLETFDKEMTRAQAARAPGTNTDADAARAAANVHARMQSAIAAMRHVRDITSSATLTGNGIRISGDVRRK